MTEAFVRPGLSLLPIERPRCRECHGRMLAHIQLGPNGAEIRTFECPKCEHVQKRLVEDPLKVSEHGLDGRRASSAEIASVRLFVPERITGHRLEYRLWSFVTAMNSPDQETVLRAVEDARRILGEYIEPGQRDATRTVERLLAVLDKSDVVHAFDRINRRRVLRLIE